MLGSNVRPARATMLAAVALAVASACSAGATSSADPASGASPRSAASGGPASPSDPLVAMDACMERAGLDLVSVDAEGRSSIDVGNDDPAFGAAFERCRNETGFAGFGPPSLSPDDIARSNEDRAKLIACMGERGWELIPVPGPIAGVVMPEVPPGQQAVFDHDLGECGEDGAVGAEPVQP